MFVCIARAWRSGSCCGVQRRRRHTFGWPIFCYDACSMHPLFSILIVLNSAVFLLYGFDKLLAVLKMRRVPERWLWSAALLGGVIGALAGMLLFRHKTAKTSFQLVLALGILVEVLIVVFFLQIF